MNTDETPQPAQKPTNDDLLYAIIRDLLISRVPAGDVFKAGISFLSDLEEYATSEANAIQRVSRALCQAAEELHLTQDYQRYFHKAMQSGNSTDLEVK